MSLPRQCCRSRCNSAPIVRSIRRPNISTARGAASAASSCRAEIHRHAHPHFPSSDGAGALALQRLGDVEVARNPASARQPSGCECGTHRRCAGAHPDVTRLIYPGRADHPQAAIIKRQMSGGGTLVAFEVPGGKPGAFRCRMLCRSSKFPIIWATRKASSHTRRRRLTSG